jgi:mercuric ion transport protein
MMAETRKNDGQAGSGAGKRDDRLLKYGLIGTVLVALCCFTPILVILLGAVGLSAVLGWLDIVLLPALAVFVGITLYALWRRRRTT